MLLQDELVALTASASDSAPIAKSGLTALIDRETFGGVVDCDAFVHQFISLVGENEMEMDKFEKDMAAMIDSARSARISQVVHQCSSCTFTSSPKSVWVSEYGSCSQVLRSTSPARSPIQHADILNESFENDISFDRGSIAEVPLCNLKAHIQWSAPGPWDARGYSGRARCKEREAEAQAACRYRPTGSRQSVVRMYSHFFRGS